jgi:hypothetical protein
MARAITQDMDRPSLHRLHNRNNNRNSSTNQEINIKASVVVDERAAAVAVVVADTVVMADIHMRP